jgi:hypothetical protein
MPNNTALERDESFSQFFRDASYTYTLSRIHNLLQRQIVFCDIIYRRPEFIHGDLSISIAGTKTRHHFIPTRADSLDYDAFSQQKLHLLSCTKFSCGHLYLS